MKKILLSMAGLMMAGTLTVYAQDTTRMQPQQQQPPVTPPTTQPVPAQPPAQQQTDQLRRDNMSEVPQNEIPSSLRRTLRGDEYRGWENSTIYRDRETNEYSLDIMDGNQSRTYRFDRSGKRIQDQTNRPDDN